MPAAMGEALDGETLMLGPVPAWRLPVHQRGEADAGAAARLPGGAPSATRTRGAMTAAFFTRGGKGSRPPGQDASPAAPKTAAPKAAAVEDGPDRTARTDPAQFGWFGPGR